MDSIIDSPAFRELFWGRVQPAGQDDCWPWMRGCFDTGYGSIRIKGKQLSCHRLAFRLSRGQWPKVACHTCDNPICCNPHHIVDRSFKWNTQDMLSKGRNVPPKGVRNGQAKFTEDEVHQMRSLHQSGSTLKQLCDLFGCCIASASMIVNRKRWKHL